MVPWALPTGLLRTAHNLHVYTHIACVDGESLCVGGVLPKPKCLHSHIQCTYKLHPTYIQTTQIKPALLKLSPITTTLVPTPHCASSAVKPAVQLASYFWWQWKRSTPRSCSLLSSRSCVPAHTSSSRSHLSGLNTQILGLWLPLLSPGCPLPPNHSTCSAGCPSK